MSEVARIALIHTNDLHSHLDIWPHTVTVIRQELARAEAEGRPAVYVNAGDQMDMGERVCYGTRGRIALDTLADAGCRAFTVGNNEVNRMDLAALGELAARSPFPWLGSNMRDMGGAPFPGLQDTCMLQVGPVKLGLFGMTPLGPACVAQGIAQVDELAMIAGYVRDLRATGADLVVHLSHFGVEYDRWAVEAVQGIDLVVGGHSHRVFEQPEVMAGVPVAQAGCFGQYVGVLELDVDLTARRLVRCEGRLVPVDPTAVPADSSALTVVERGRSAAEEALNEVVTVLPEALPHDPTGESRLGPAIAEALRQRAGAEIGLIAGGQAVTGLPAGSVTRSAILEALPALFIPALLEMTGATLQALLEQSEDPQHHGFKMWDSGMRPRGRAVGRIFTAGVSQEGGRLFINGQPLDPERVYTAGGPSLLSFVESGYTAAAGVKLIRRFMPELVRETFEGFLRSGSRA